MARKPEQQEPSESPTVDVSGAFSSRTAKDYEQPLPPRAGSGSLLEGLMADAALRHAFNGEGSNERSVIEIEQAGQKIRVEIDPASLRALHGNLKTTWRIFRLVRDLLS